MPFNNWDIPASLFSTKPVSKATLQNFIGRDQVINRIKRFISMKNERIVFEGEIGTGKTSLGNYIRFTQAKSFSTDIEILCNPRWGSTEFLLALQSSVVGTCRKQKDFEELLSVDIFKRIEERNSNIRISNFQGGANVFGSGASGGKSESISHPYYLDDHTLINELADMLLKTKELVTKKQKCSLEEVRVIFQMNNLDPKHPPFDEKSIIIFLNSIRDILTDKVDASFIINGAIGLSQLIQRKVHRLSDFVKFEKVKPLTKDELVGALHKRIKNSAYNGNLPFTDELIQEVYSAANGNFRKTLGVMEELASHYDANEPLIGDINFDDCYRYFYQFYGDQITSYSHKGEKLTNKGKITRELSETPRMSIKEIATKLDLDVGNISRSISSLEDDGVLVKIKDDDYTTCLLNAELYFASKLVFPERIL